MARKSFHLGLAVLLFLSILAAAIQPAPVLAEDIWTPITTPAEFNNIRTGLGGNYRLMADIDLASSVRGTPNGS